MIVYVHGFNSAGTSAKAAALRERLAPLSMLSPTYPAHRPHQAVAQLSRCLESLPAGEEVALIGSSMGGFYGQYLARRYRVRHLYMINPALLPWTLAPGFLGEQINPETGEGFELRLEDVEVMHRYGLDRVCDGVPTTLFLDRGDEVIDYRQAQSLYRECGRLFVYPGGSHRFDHMDQAAHVIRGDYGM